MIPLPYAPEGRITGIPANGQLLEELAAIIAQDDMALYSSLTFADV